MMIQYQIGASLQKIEAALARMIATWRKLRELTQAGAG